ncbi:hypothetical protein NR798_07875 [Archangium gephyra]|uniref:DUF7948 domain-containing protein n=1 Tax=Archangium gephyra TaxID=48 RepID=UPI0035D47BE5
MSHRSFGVVAAAAAILVLCGGAMGQRGSSSAPAMVQAPAPLKAPVFRPGIAPVHAGSEGRYELRHLHSRALFTDRGVELRLPSRLQESRALGWSVAGGRAVPPLAEKPREAKLHRLLGPEESWEREVPTYGGLRYPDVLPGVELWFEERAEGVEYGFRAERGEDLRRVELEYAGAREVRVVEEGRALEVDLGEGVLREQGLHCAQEAADGSMKAVGCRFAHARPVGQERWAYAIEVDVEDPGRPVVVDPLVLWNTYLGGRGGNYNELRAIEQNSTGDVFIVGTTDTPPASPPLDSSRSFGGLGGVSDVLVARFNRDGGLVWSAVLGGGGGDLGMGLAIGDADELYIAGSTGSPDFQQPLSDGGTASSPTLGSVDGFVARLDPTGTQLGWFVRLGGNNVDYVNGLLRTPDHQLYAIGYTSSTNIPNLQGVTDPTIRGEEGFISRINPDVTPTAPLWTVLVQGPGNESLSGLAHDTGSLYVTGRTAPVSGGSQDALVAVIDGIGTLAPSIVKRFTLGGTGFDDGRAVRIGGAPTQREVQVFGTTESKDFAGGAKGGSDVFVATYPTYASNSAMPQQKLGLLGSTAGGEYIWSLTADDSGRVYIGGTTTSILGLATSEAFESTYSGGIWDGFVARVNLDAQPVLEWASYVGGEGEEQVYALHVDRLNPARLLFGGSTNSVALMYSDAGYDTSPNLDAIYEMFLMTVDLDAPTPVPPGPDGGTPPDGGMPPDAGAPGPLRSPVGWSCGSSTSGDGPAALALTALAVLVVLVSHRRRLRA